MEIVLDTSMYALINTKNINKTWTPHKTNSSKDGQNKVLREIRSGNENMKFDKIEQQGTPLRQIQKGKPQELRKGMQFLIHYCYRSCYC
jgi:hypothetical protein